MQIHKTGIKIHPAAACGGFPLDSFLSESSKCEGVEKQPAARHVSCTSLAGNTAVVRSKTDISMVSGAMLPVLFVPLENMLFSCFVASSVAHWLWQLSSVRDSLSCFSVENWILDKMILGGNLHFLSKVIQQKRFFFCLKLLVIIPSVHC